MLPLGPYSIMASWIRPVSQRTKLMKEPMMTMEGGKYCCRVTRPAMTKSQTSVMAQATIRKGKSLEGGRNIS